MPHDVEGAPFWNDRYLRGEDGWELGTPAPPLARILKDSPPSVGRAAVPGCGRGHDVAAFLQHGFDAVGFDFSDRAVAEAARLGRPVLQRDIFSLDREFSKSFDVVWEYTCYCAIHPSRRRDYIAILAEILKPGGLLIGLFYPLKPGTEGPPFPVDRSELETLLVPDFHIESAAIPQDSVDRRKGLELLLHARRLSGPQ